MLLDDVKKVIDERRKGTYLSLQKTKDFGNGLVKISDITIRIGCAYGKIGNVISQHEEGWTPQSLPWGKWVEGYENLLIEHKGNYYLRVSNDYCDRNTCHYELNGNEISRDQVISLIGEKKIKTGNQDVYNIKLENIVQIY